MKMTNVFLLLIAFLFTLDNANATAVTYGAPAITAYPTVRPVSRVGKVTGEGCRTDGECIVGCTAGQPDDLKCLTMAEASNECVDPDKAPSVDYPCVCLPDVGRCGFAFGAVTTQETVITTNKTVETTVHGKQPAKKPAAKKSAAKKKTTHKKKAAMKKTDAPTPITPPANTPAATTPTTAPAVEPK